MAGNNRDSREPGGTGLQDKSRVRGNARRFIKVERLFALSVLPIAWLLTPQSLVPSPKSVLLAILVVIATLTLLDANVGVVWRFHTRRNPESIDKMKFPDPVERGNERLRFAIVVAALNEVGVLGKTLLQHAKQDHADTTMYVSLQDHDLGTIAEARAVADMFPDRIKLVIGNYDAFEGKTMKADQLNFAIDQLGEDVDFIGIGDAETLFPATLMRHVEALILQEKADVVQGAVMLTNIGDKNSEFWMVHNAMEYFSWFTSRMHFQADRNYMPYGGNTIFINLALLRKVGGIPRHRTEDCKLGTKMAVMGIKPIAAYDPSLCSQEHTPPTLWGTRVPDGKWWQRKGGWFGQRVRWDRGFYEVKQEGEWRNLPTREQRFLAWYFLTTPFIQAFNALLLPLAFFTTFWVDAPVFLVIWLYTPYVPIAVSMAMQLVGFREYSKAFQLDAHWWHYAWLLFGSFPYYVLLMMAAVKSIYDHHTHKDTGWGSKTDRITDPHKVGGFKSVPAMEASK